MKTLTCARLRHWPEAHTAPSVDLGHFSLDAGCLGPQCQAYALLLGRSSHTLNLGAPCQVQVICLRIFPANQEMLSALIQSAVSLLIKPPCDVGHHWSWEPQEGQDLLFLSIRGSTPTLGWDCSKSSFLPLPSPGKLFCSLACCSFSASSHLQTFITFIILGPTRARCWLSKHALLIWGCWVHSSWEHTLDMVPVVE